MCDYSLEAQESRPAEVGEYVRTSAFPGTSTKGFCAVGQSGVAVCMLPGTELAFEKTVTWHGIWPMLKHLFRESRSQTAVFRQINDSTQSTHHDALELDDGTVVLLTHLREGQIARVLQMPATAKPRRGPARQAEEPELQMASVS